MQEVYDGSGGCFLSGGCSMSGVNDVCFLRGVSGVCGVWGVNVGSFLSGVNGGCFSWCERWMWCEWGKWWMCLSGGCILSSVNDRCSLNGVSGGYGVRGF